MSTWRNNYAKLVSRYPHKVGAEVGVLKGENSVNLLDKLPGLKLLYCVDTWRGKLGPSNMEKCMLELKPYMDRVKILRMRSEKAAKKVPDLSLDFVFIDANHRYESVILDINSWMPKLRSGGLLSGHDYIDYKKEGIKSGYNVKKAVDELFPNANFQGTVWWILKK